MADYKKLKSALTKTEQVRLGRLERKTNRMYRDFWIGVMKRMGYSNVQIAKEVGLSESNVRVILQKP